MASAETAWTCVTCGSQAKDHYCSHCGEAKPDHTYSFHHVFEHAFETWFHLDSKIPRTLGMLAGRPGSLTASYFRGERKPFVSPFLVFFWASLVFYLVQSATGLVLFSPPLRVYSSPWQQSMVERRIEAKHIAHEEFTEKFDHASAVASKSLVIVMAVAFSLALWVVYAARGRYWIEHLVFSMHAYSFWMFWLSLMLVIALTAARVLHLRSLTATTDNILTALEFGGLLIYLFGALRRFYGDGPAPAALRCVALTAGAYALLFAYRWMLFFVGVYSS
ncbi:MAG: DUF3667 domain-containing protein [Bryobacteraceae bacterium]